MRILGIIVEYNPFHLGHLHHLQTAIRTVHPERVIAVMSGNFVQRGEPAIVDKFARTKMALKAGVDVVLELPAVFAIQDASAFAYGAISTLDALNVVTDVVFGSETDNIEALEKMADVVVDEPAEYREKLKKYLKDGHSFPNARRFAMKDFLSNVDTDEIKHSNNILGLEYIVSIKKLNSNMNASTIRRIGSSYNDSRITSIPSATAIRRVIKEKKKLKGVPDFSTKILEDEFKSGRGPVFPEVLYEYVKMKIVILGREGLESLYGFNEGMAQRMVDCVKKKDMMEFLSCVKTKRFTLTRIKRRMLYALFDITREFVLDSNEYGPQYVRVLGFKRESTDILRRISDHSRLPVITNSSRFNKSLEKRNVYSYLAKKQFELDLKASDVYALLLEQGKLRQDFRGPVIM